MQFASRSSMFGAEHLLSAHKMLSLRCTTVQIVAM